MTSGVAVMKSSHMDEAMISSSVWVSVWSSVARIDKENRSERARHKRRVGLRMASWLV